MSEASNKHFKAIVADVSVLDKRPGLSFVNLDGVYSDSYTKHLTQSQDLLMTLDEALAAFDKYSKNKANRTKIQNLKEGGFVVAGRRSIDTNVFIVRIPQEDVDYYSELNRINERIANARNKINAVIPKELSDELKAAEKELKVLKNKK